MALSSLLAHMITTHTNPDKYPPPIVTPPLHDLPCQNSHPAHNAHSTPFTGIIYSLTWSAVSLEINGTCGVACAGGGALENPVAERWIARRRAVAVELERPGRVPLSGGVETRMRTGGRGRK